MISGVYTGDKEGEYRISLYRSVAESGYSFNFVGLEGRGAGSVNTRVPQPLGKDGLYILFPDNFSRHFNLEWVIPIPNHRSPTYISAKDAYERALQDREPSIQRAKENLNQLKEELALVRSGSRAEHIEAQRALVRRAEAMVASAQNALAKRLIRAPFAGEVMSITTRAGENVSPGQTLITVANEGALKLKVYVSPDKARLISIGNGVKIAGEYNGTVMTKASGVDPRTGQVEVQISVNGPSGLLIGEYREAEIFADVSEGSLWIPLSAVRVDSSGSFVLTVKDGEVQRTPVQTGEVEGGNVSILSELDDSLLIVKDSRQVSLGQKVEIKRWND